MLRENAQVIHIFVLFALARLIMKGSGWLPILMMTNMTWGYSYREMDGNNRKIMTGKSVARPGKSLLLQQNGAGEYRSQVI